MTDSETPVPVGKTGEGTEPTPENTSAASIPEEPVEAESKGAQQAAGSEPGAAKAEEPKEETGEERPKAPEYQVVPSKREEPESSFVAGHLISVGAQGQGAGGDSQFGPAGQSEGETEQNKKLAAAKTKVYAATGIGLGLLVGVVCAAMFIHPGNQSAANDLGQVAMDEYGLKGHLVADWKDKLEYHLTIEPSDPGQRAAFAADVNSSPRPLTVGIQLKDPFGTSLCGTTILLKFDPRNGPAGAIIEPGPKAGKAERDLAIRNQIAQGIVLAKLENQELDREHGKDMFQSDAGPDGQVASIRAQGMLPCTKKQFDTVVSWSFTSNFPIVAPPAANESSSPGSSADEETPPSGGASKSGAEAAKSPAEERAKRRPTLPQAPVSIEGDDQIVWYDPAMGIVETSAGKALMIDKNDAVANALKERDFPITIHYRCDETGACTFAGVGAGIEHARLRR